MSFETSHLLNRSLLASLRTGAFGSVAALLMSTTPAAAADEGGQTAPAETEERPKMNLSVAPNEPAVPRTDYVHRGLYARFSVGPGYMYSSLTNKDLDNSSSASSFAVGADLLVGGSPSPGMILGGGALAQLGFGADHFGNGSSTLFHFTAGPFFDAFPNDRDGFHMGTLLGFSGLTVNDQVGTLFGGGGAAWLGYDMWVAPEWSTGFNVQMGGSYHAGSEFSGGVFHTTLMITILHN